MKTRIVISSIFIISIYITGGETALIPWMSEFINWLLGERYFVTLFTSLGHYQTDINNSYRFQIISTYHHHTDAKHYDKVFSLYRNAGYQIKSTEIGLLKHISYSKLHPYTNEAELKMPMFRISPDLHIHSSCYDMYMDKNYLK